MEVVFIRHGHGEHLLDHPNRLNTLHPGLTKYGEMQVRQLGQQIKITNDDLMLVSPTKRTIQTAQMLVNGDKFIVSPLVGPRMFPQNPAFPFFGCDQIFSKEELVEQYNHIPILDFDLNCWDEGINRIDHALFEYYAKRLLDWCLEQQKRIFVVSHDGTITNYRLLLGENGLTREDFLGEAGVYKMTI